MVAPLTRAKFLYTDMNPASVVPVTVELLQDVDEPPRVLRDPHPDYAGDWVYDGTDDDAYVYREQTDDTERSSLSVAQEAAAAYGTPMPTIPDDPRAALTGTASDDDVPGSRDDGDRGYLPPTAGR